MKYATTLDRQHALRKLAAHRIIARCLRGDKGQVLINRTRRAFNDMQREHGATPYVLGWSEILTDDRWKIAQRIILRDDHMETLRETSPFMKVFGFDLGQKMHIDFQDPETRKRMWNLAKRLATIEPPEQEVLLCRQPTL